MKEAAANRQANIETAAVTDRGLSEKRPHNEDSFYSDPQRHIFAVADGVGGANAGEVASQTAIDVLSEAFRHNLDDADIEDLMELAIQRANASIHQMAKEQPKFSMMATTVVALHLDGYRATIGHVGDSRLYRLTPDGRLHRETEDHSVVEEEVRAGRMTPAQAATHPSRNVISRALGAEESVEVDMKTIEVEDGTVFLLCSDGITRHIPDNEIRDLLASGVPLSEVGEEMKRRCYERGAEDNLTALMVRVGASAAVPAQEQEDQRQHETLSDDDVTMMSPRPGIAATIPEDDGVPTAPLNAQAVMAVNQETPSRGIDRLLAGSNGGASSPAQGALPLQVQEGVGPQTRAQAGPASRSAAGTLVRLLLVLMGIVAAGGISFFIGRSYQRQLDLAKAASAVAPSPTPWPEEPAAKFEKRRREVDADPKGALNRLSMENGGRPLDSTDPELLYLYGRALMLSGRHAEANEAFLKSLDQLKDRPSHDPLKVEARISSLAAAFKSKNFVAVRAAEEELDKLIQSEQTSSASEAESQPSVSLPAAGAVASPAQ